MAKTTRPSEAVIIDDEMHNMLWLVDYLEGKEFKVHRRDNLNSAIELIDREIFRFLVIDLNIPMLPPLARAVSEKGAIYAKFPGLYAAYHARNRGYRDRQVIIYSVHRDTEASRIAAKLLCTYVLKGRPKEIKKEIEAVLSYDPTDV